MPRHRLSEPERVVDAASDDHHPGRQRPRAPLAGARMVDDPVHQLGREHLRQHADADPVRQTVPGDYLPWPRHAGDLTPM